MPTRLLLTLPFLLLPASVCLAADTEEEQWYQVEVIVFAHQATDGDNNESWPDDPGRPDLQDTIPLQQAGMTGDMNIAGQDTMIDPLTGVLVQDARAGDKRAALDDKITTVRLLPDATDAMTEKQAAVQETPFRLLDNASLQLNTAYEKLAKTDGYIPLMHIAWRQPVLSRTQGQPVKVDSRQMMAPDTMSEPAMSRPDGNPAPARDSMSPDQLAIPPRDPLLFADQATDTLPAIGTRDEQQTMNLSLTGDSTLASMTPPPSRIEGTIKITRGRYLHVTMDMLYRPEKEVQQNTGFFSFFAEDKTPDYYRLTQRRRVRSNELHYFDHPKFGVLTLVTPYALPEAGEQTGTIPLDLDS